MKRKSILVSLFAVFVISCAPQETSLSKSVDSSSQDTFPITNISSYYQMDYQNLFALKVDNGFLYKKVPLDESGLNYNDVLIEQYDVCCAFYVKSDDCFLASPQSSISDISLLNDVDYYVKFYVREKMPENSVYNYQLYERAIKKNKQEREMETPEIAMRR